MIELHPTPDALSDLGLPSIPYPVALPAFQAAVANDGALPLADMLHGLQLRAAAATDVARLEPAMMRLAELLAASDEARATRAPGFDRWLDYGAVDLDGPAVAIRRGASLLAAVTPHGDGRLRVAAYRPLDARAAAMLLGFATEDGWQRALDATASAPATAAETAVAAFIVHRDTGIGTGADGGAPAMRPAAHLRAELATCHAFGTHARR